MPDEARTPMQSAARTAPPAGPARLELRQARTQMSAHDPAGPAASARLAALVTALSLSSCTLGTTEVQVEASPLAGSNRPSEEPTNEPEPSPSETGDATLSFGQSYTWEDGISLTVSKPKPFKPGEHASKEKAKAYVRFTVTVVNKSSKPLDLNLTYITVQSDNKEASTVFDSQADLGGAPSTKLLKGRGAESEIGFGVGNPKDLVMEVALQDDFEHPSLLYQT